MGGRRSWTQYRAGELPTFCCRATVPAAYGIKVDCYDAVGESQTVTEGILLAQLAKATSASPSILLLDHIEALAKKSESSATGRAPAIVKIIEDVMEQARVGSATTGWPIIIIGTTVDEDSVPGELLAMFKQDITLPVSRRTVPVVDRC